MTIIKRTCATCAAFNPSATEDEEPCGNLVFFTIHHVDADGKPLVIHQAPRPADCCDSHQTHEEDAAETREIEAARQLKERAMTNPFEADYKALHAAALTLGTKMLATLPQAQLDHMAQCTTQGAKLMFEIELPNCKEVALVMREIEGKRLPVCRLGITPG